MKTIENIDKIPDVKDKNQHSSNSESENSSEENGHAKEPKHVQYSRNLFKKRFVFVLTV